MGVALCERQLAAASLILCSSAVNIYWCDGGGWPSFWEAEDAGGDGQLERTCMGWAGHCLLLCLPMITQAVIQLPLMPD